MASPNAAFAWGASAGTRGVEIDVAPKGRADDAARSFMVPKLGIRGAR